ncbi:MAG: PAS-domain containing protein [Alphaproteobacteria bacterium]
MEANPEPERNGKSPMEGDGRGRTAPPALLREAFDHLDQAVSVLDGDFRLVLFNESYVKLLEFPDGFLRPGMDYEEIVRFNAGRGEYGPGEVESLTHWRMEWLQRRKTFCIERLRPNGRLLEMCGRPLPGGGMVFSYTDITDRKNEEVALLKANRALKILGGLGKALAHAITEQELLNQACRILVEAGGYRMAWVGIALYDEEQTVHPLAHYGRDACDPALLRTSWSDSPGRRASPTGEAIRCGAPAVKYDLAEDREEEPSLSVLARLGFRSVVALPLHEGTAVLGALTLCAEEPGALAEAEVGLLVDFANDLAYGLRALRHAAERLRALEELRDNLISQEIVATILRGSLRAVSLTEILADTLALVVSSRRQGLLPKGAIFLAEGDHLVMKAHYRLSDDSRKACARIPLGWCLCGQAAKSGEMIHASSVNDHHDHVHSGEHGIHEDHGHYCVPIRSDETVLGVLNLYVSSGHQSDPILERFVTTVADTLAGVIRRRHAEESLSRAHDNLEMEVEARTRELRQEIEERHAADLALRRSERKYRTVIDTASEGFWMIDASTRTVDVNDSLCRMLGYAREEIIGKSLLDFADEDSRFPLEEQLVTSLWQDRRSFEATLAAKGGRRLFAEFHTTMFENAAGSLRGQFAFVTDITARKAAEAELRRATEQTAAASRAKSEFLASVSHELRTPLNAIIGFSDAIISEVFGPLGNERYQGYIDDIHRSGVHLLALINDILDIAKVEAGKVELHEEELEITHTVKACLRLLRPRAQEMGVKLYSRIPKDLPRLFADERRLKQILLNLVTNAVKFSPQGEVTVQAGLLPDGELTITVTDSGIGISPEDLAKVLEPFHQVDSHLTRKEGTGLGLPLTRGLVEAHGGVFEIESHPGVGTKVTTRFPAHRVCRFGEPRR